MNRSLILAVVIALGVGGWLASGEITGSGRETSAATPDAAAVTEESAAGAAQATAAKETRAAGAFSVRVKRLQATPRSRDIIARGRTDINRMVDVKAEVMGRVAEVVAIEGSFVKAGAVLAELDLRDRLERLAEAKAVLAQREIEYDAAKRLRAKGFRAQTKTAESAAQFESAKANLASMEVALDRTVIRAPFSDLASMEVALDRTVIRAPFSGVVEHRHVELGDFVDMGDPIARVVDRSPILIIAYVSERDVGFLSRKTKADVTLATGEKLDGSLKYIASMADDETRTFRVEFRAPNPGLKMRAGVTAELRISVDAVPAHFVSPAMLTLNDEGQLGVKLVNRQNNVEFHRADIISDEPDGVWLGGLPQSIRVITVGQEYVRDGDPVRAVPDKTADAS